jgi:hypothetical protein
MKAALLLLGLLIARDPAGSTAARWLARAINILPG